MAGYSITLDALSRTYEIPVGGNTDWRGSMSRYIRDSATVINSLSSGGVATQAFNVQNYGATGNGSTDDTTAIRAAMAALAALGTQGGTLYFPRGTYKVTGSLQFGVAASQANVKLTGDGSSSIISQFGAFSTSPLIEFRNCNYWSVSGLQFTAASSSGTGDIILADGCDFGAVVGCGFTSAQRYAINLSQVSGSSTSVSNYFEDNVFVSSTSGDVFTTTDGALKGLTPRVLVQGPTGTFFYDRCLNVRDFGAKGDGTTSDTVAVQAALNALFDSNDNGRTLFFPKGDYRITGTLTINGRQGFRLVGEGDYASKLSWDGPAGDDFLYVGHSQLWAVENLMFWGNAAARPRSMIRSHMPLVYDFAAYGITFRDILISSTAVDGFDYGIWFDTEGSGNNSEVNYFGVFVDKAKEDCIRLEGSQAKSHRFFGCNFTSAKKGIHCYDPGGGIGAPYPSAIYGGNIASCTEAGITLTYPGDPMVVDGVQSEHCYRFLDAGGSPSTGVAAIAIRDCRLDCAATVPTPAFSSFIQVSGLGPFIFEGNHVAASSDGIPQIKLSASGDVVGRIKNNFFQSENSVSTNPVNNGSSFFYSGLDVRDNVFYDSSSQPTYRLEPLQTALPEPTKVFIQNSPGDNHVTRMLLTPPKESFTAAALTQTLSLVTLPKGARLQAAYFYVHDAFAKGGAALTWKLGTTSGGNEILLAADVKTNALVLFGQDTSHLGATMTGTTYSQGGYVGDYFATTTLYLTMTSGSGNLGNGSVTNLTAGKGFIILEVVTLPRWLT